LLNFLAEQEQTADNGHLQQSIGPVISEQDIAILEKS
jgi:hypothetical protein